MPGHLGPTDSNSRARIALASAPIAVQSWAQQRPEYGSDPTFGLGADRGENQRAGRRIAAERSCVMSRDQRTASEAWQMVGATHHRVPEAGPDETSTRMPAPRRLVEA